MYRKRGRNSKKPNKAIFEQMYYGNSMTVYEIAKFYNVSIHTIYKWAYDFRKEEKLHKIKNTKTEITLSTNKSKQQDRHHTG